ncbi:MAG: zinc metalloprotease, partial [Bacteroidota bacterium]
MSLNFTRLFLLLAVVLCGSLTTSAQRSCGSMEILEEQMRQDPARLDQLNKLEIFTRNFQMEEGRKAVITIPVVVHVVYRTSTENVSLAQINSQIQVLNEDFRRTNGDADGTWPQAADSEIEFCLASIDPNGNATDGIIRQSTTRNGFGTNNAVKFASSGGSNAWPADKYMNMWVCNIGGGILGYAQFPGGPANTDGVVIDYRYFGTNGTATAPFNLGRTGTHEVGHYLNLRHIWGDTGCGGDDFVADTPLAGGPNYTGTPCNFPGPNSCNTGAGDDPDMFQNYMDYSDDGCMNLFTTGQKTRMQAALSGARSGLLSSNGCGTPAAPTCDDGVQNGDETGVDCGGSCAPCSAGCADTEVTLNLLTDNYASETSWTLSGPGGTIASGSGYANNTNYSETFCLPDGCYTFTINDSYGDGICCGYGNGSYSLTNDNTGASLGAGGNFGFSETQDFCLGGGPAPTCDDG